MRVLIVTSCTGTKAIGHPDALTMDDFRRGTDHVASRSRGLPSSPAEELYTGEQHARLMAGVWRLRKALGPGGGEVDVWIVSAGYGLVRGDRTLAPYESTFTGMGKAAARAWAAELGIPGALRAALAEPYDLALVLLGDGYFDAVGFGPDVALSGPTRVVTSAKHAGKLAGNPRLLPLALSTADTRRFGAGFVAIKGEVGGRALALLAEEHMAEGHGPEALLGPGSAVLDRLAAAPAVSAARPERRVRATVSPNPEVERVIDLPLAWRERTARSPLRYFIPDWDDRVDPGFDFATERHAGGRGDWSNEVYAHQLYPEPSYDGILVSRATIDESAGKRRLVEELGVHRFLRVPRDMPVMGDCGAFSYVGEENPPYSTADVLDYYTSLGFDLGVSVDHLLFVGDAAEHHRRYALTIANAEAFLAEHRARGLPWTPMGAVQGWDPASYAAAARQYVAMGYGTLALGGMVRSRDREILAVLEAVHDAVPAGTDLHVLGVARLGMIPGLLRLGVTSVDSASYLRSSWMSASRNYLAEDGWYTAIRIPALASAQVQDGFLRDPATADRLRDMERACLGGVHAAAGAAVDLPKLADTLIAYPEAYKAFVARLRAERSGHPVAEAPVPSHAARSRGRDRILRTLTARPWEHCGCPICAALGVDVIVFRGNNRNRRRGFHNTHMFSRLLGRLLSGQDVPWLAPNDDSVVQLELARV